LYPVDDMRNYNIGKVLKLYIIDETHCSWAYPWEQKEDETSERLKDLSKAMRTLGYNKEEIAKVNTLDYTQCPELSDMISEAIKYLSRNPL
jgi:Holliday junction resolvasome RuvABC DNA-binding subunit